MNKIIEYVTELKHLYGSSDPFFICEKLDINIICIDLPMQVKGFYVKFLESKIIYINCHINEKQKRYICAHELGHAIFHENINSMFINKKSSPISKKYRNQADCFAACLLIDENFFDKNNSSSLSIDQIAIFSGVDKKLVEIRMNVI